MGGNRERERKRGLELRGESVPAGGEVGYLSVLNGFDQVSMGECGKGKGEVPAREKGGWKCVSR